MQTQRKVFSLSFKSPDDVVWWPTGTVSVQSHTVTRRQKDMSASLLWKRVYRLRS